MDGTKSPEYLLVLVMYTHFLGGTKRGTPHGFPTQSGDSKFPAPAGEFSVLNVVEFSKCSPS